LREARPTFSGRVEVLLYALAAAAWIGVALLHPDFLPVFPLFILFAVVGVWLIPALVRRHLR
jgi:hypothetical protein